MNAMPDWNLWRPSFATIALGATAVFLVFLLALRWVQSMTWRRTLWQIAFLSVGLLALAELTGTGRLASNWTRKTVDTPDQTTTLIEAKILDEPDPQLLAAARAQKVDLVTKETVNTVASSTSLQWPTALWIGGTGVVLSWTIVLRLCFWLLVRRRIVRDEALLARVDTIARRLGLSQQVRVTEVRRLTGPIAHGNLRPGISLPEGFAEHFPTAQQDVMLAHELAHLTARDPLWHTIVDIVLSLVWWHPLAWLARHELHAVTEAAADEACLVIDNGPTALAECLVDLGNRLSHRRSLGWLGMAGGGFRSGLAKRVSRLLATESQRWNPPAPYRVWLTRAMSSLAISAVILVGAAWAQPTAVGPTNLRDAFQQSVFGIMLTIALPTPQQTAEATNQTAEVLPPPAPQTSTSDYFIRAGDTLSRIVSAFHEQGSSITQPDMREANPHVQWNRLRIGQRIIIPVKKNLSKFDRRKLLNAELDSIFLDEVKFDGETLGEAIGKLRKAVRDRSPSNLARNLIIEPHLAQGINPATGLPVTYPAGASQRDSWIKLNWPSIFPNEETLPPLHSVALHTTTLRNATLRETLDAIVASASTAIRYSVEDYGVVFTSTNPLPRSLHSRFFKIEPERFEKALLSRAKIDLDQAISNAVHVSRPIDIPPGWYTPLTAPSMGPALITRSDLLLSDTRRYFGQLGVDFSAPGHQLVFSDRKGMLMVRATLDELDIIEAAMSELTAPPPQVTIEASVFEITDEDARALGLDWRLGNVLGSEFANLFQTPQPQTKDPLTSAPRQTTNFQATGILTEAQCRVVLRAMSQYGLTNLLNTPKMTTLSGRPGQFKHVRVRYVVTDLDWANDTTNRAIPPQPRPISEPFELGPVLNVVPYVRADAKTIELTAIPTITELLGYDLDNGKERREIVTMADGSKQVVLVPAQRLPIFRKRQIVSSATVKDGHTLVLAGGSDQFLVNPTRSQPLQPGTKIPTNSAPTHLLIFVTPTLIDPAGNRINPPE